MTVYVPQFADTPVKAFLAEAMNIEVRSNVPDKWTPGQAPVLVIADDGGPEQFPVSTSATIRITGWASGQTEARAIVTRAWGLLLCSRVPGLARVRPGIRPFDVGKDVKHPTAILASATVLATIRTTTL
ncbi:hypothetical protein [Gordonia rubripertincta]|uniref:hypothetical protein n=1 Tax=Gordonia rubripertincta TaxID=36822 RepID=UPI0015FBD711|nr:hypothetical protein [Gordonia rubripertincta]QMU22504.1 hypothetical protein H3V45_08570 [Gordonia rubripertincta]